MMFQNPIYLRSAGTKVSQRRRGLMVSALDFGSSSPGSGAV